MEKRYERNLPALSETDCSLLREKTVCIVGCGGLGGYLTEYLARLGIGTIRCVDGDAFDETNLNRQLLSTEKALGVCKAEAAAARVRAVNSDVTAQFIPAFLTEANARGIIEGCDAVLDALDSIPARRILAAACDAARIPYIYGAISGWVAQAGVSLPGDALIEKLYPKDTVLTDKSVLSFTPALCASMQAALCVKVLTGQDVETGVIHYADLSHMEFETIPLG